jgi:FixJ family two-component response regulator
MKDFRLFLAHEGFRESLPLEENPRGDSKEISNMNVQTIKISVVDDDESMRKATKTLLELFGIKVEGFASAEEFLNSSTKQDSACLILDVRMTGISGFELQGILNRVNRPVPIIFITADYSEEDRARAIEAGAIEYLKKPFRVETLLNAISSALGIKRRNASDSIDQDR